jgi:hypothetical protein
MREKASYHSSPGHGSESDVSLLQHALGTDLLEHSVPVRWRLPRQGARHVGGRIDGGPVLGGAAGQDKGVPGGSARSWRPGPRRVCAGRSSIRRAGDDRALVQQSVGTRRDLTNSVCAGAGVDNGHVQVLSDPIDDTKARLAYVAVTRTARASTPTHPAPLERASSRGRHAGQRPEPQ